VPDLPDTIVIQLTLLTAVQEHPDPAITPTEALPPIELALADFEDKE
jgi:hypothetical protein